MDIWLSIIIPIYNVEKYLEECIESILRQNFKEYEVILVDDGSKDHSGEICDNYSSKYPFIKTIHKENGGLSDARNVGIRNSNGVYLLFIDGDDYIFDNSLENIYSTIVEKKFPDIVFLECCKFFPDSKKLVSMKDGIDEQINDLLNVEIYKYLTLLPKYPASACTKAVNREFLKRNNLYFREGLLCEDLEWASRVFAVLNTAAYCPKKYYFYRQERKDSISNSRSEKKTLDLFNIYKEIVERAEQTNVLSIKTMQYSFAEYIMRFLILYSDTLSRVHYKKMADELVKNKYILGIRGDFVSRLISLFYKFFGVKVTRYCLILFIKIRYLG